MKVMPIRTNKTKTGKAAALFMFLSLMLCVFLNLGLGLGAKQRSLIVSAVEIPTTSWVDAENYAEDYASGTGVQGDPYIIANQAQLAKLAKDNMTSKITDHFKIELEDNAKELDMSEHLFEPIGTIGTTKRFEGVFDGNGCTVKIIVNKIGIDYAGFFGYVYSASIKNLTVDGRIHGRQYVAGIAAYASNDVIIENCTNLAEITADSKKYSETDDRHFADLGGIAGYAYARTNLINCINKGSITAYEVPGFGNIAYYVGGIAGQVYGASNVLNCINISDVKGGITVGGIAGDHSGSTRFMKNCFNSGEITGIQGVGGLFGGAIPASAGSVLTVENCYNTGNIIVLNSTESSARAGGIGGSQSGHSDAYSKISNVYNTGIVSGPSGKSYFGILFGNGSSTVFSNCYYNSDTMAAFTPETGFVKPTQLFGSKTNIQEDEVSGLTTAQMVGIDAIGINNLNFTYPDDVSDPSDPKPVPASDFWVVKADLSEKLKFYPQIKSLVDLGGEFAQLSLKSVTIDTRSTPTAPSAPEVNGTPTDNSITINEIVGAEYSKDNGATWQDSPTFNGLTANTEYTFIARFKETFDNLASANSVGTKIKTDKSTVAVPEAPTVSGTPTANSITLNTIVGAEYSKDNGATWQDSPTFNGLTANTEYTFIARIKETADSYASTNSAGTKIKTDKMTPAAPTVSGTATVNSITLNTIVGAEYSMDNGATWQDSPTFNGLTANTEYTFIARIKATADSYASADSVGTKIKTDMMTPAAPAAPAVEGKPTANSVTVTAVDGAEYSIDGGLTWQDSPIFTDLDANTEYTIVMRMKATDSTYASEVSRVLTFTTAKAGLPGGAIAAIVISSVVAVSLGGFAIFWFVLKKKNFADLLALVKKN